MRLSYGRVRAKDKSFEVSIDWRRLTYREGHRRLDIDAEQTTGTQGAGLDVYLERLPPWSGGLGLTGDERRRVQARVRQALRFLGIPFEEG